MYYLKAYDPKEGYYDGFIGKFEYMVKPGKEANYTINITKADEKRSPLVNHIFRFKTLKEVEAWMTEPRNADWLMRLAQGKAWDCDYLPPCILIPVYDEE